MTLHCGIAAPTGGHRPVPSAGAGGCALGSQPIFGATEEQRRAAAHSDRYDELPMIALDELCRSHARIDVLLVDIQGGEADLIAGCLPVICEEVAYLVVGTHSRQIEGRIMDRLLLQAAGKLGIERPAIFSVGTDEPQIIVDGVQGWRNPSLTPD